MLCVVMILAFVHISGDRTLASVHIDDDKVSRYYVHMVTIAIPGEIGMHVHMGNDSACPG